MLPRTYDSAAEPELYALWERSGAFAAGRRPEAAPYTIMLPPPNVTGQLHLGHAVDHTLQDVLARFRRMQGRDVLWQPGTDHAGIATQMVVERQLAERQEPGRRAMGREAFEARIWTWKAESGGAITAQMRRLGSSVDWSRERFTLDAGLSAAVREVFVSLHEQGLIYRDRRLVNWDPVLQSAVSDLEVEQVEMDGQFWHIRYPVEGGGDIVVATTRPETMLADTAVAVHPEDDRYRALVGRHAILPLTGRRIPIVADAYSDPEKGTGAVKITPAHDFNDFAVGRRHGLPTPSILDREARITLEEIEPAPDFVRSLSGQSREQARAAIVTELERLGLLVRTERTRHSVPHGDRSGAAIEPLLTMQWYCDAATLARPAIEAVEQGRIRFAPLHWENTFFAWMRAIEPWCISRQLWWGHRIPAWYAPDGSVFVARSEEAAQAQAGAGVALTQDEDVLDTWFSSALWPFSTLGWPERTPDLARRYPTDVLVTGFDIIFFWVARMAMMGLRVMGDVPFREVCIHGLMRDERGQKMSKSRGNVIDPLVLIEAHGADALRFAACQRAGLGRDIPFGEKRVTEARAVVTKLWNAARFCEMNGVVPAAGLDTASLTTPLARWLLADANAAIAEATAALDGFRFDEYAGAVYRFTWNVFCDWFLELAKPLLSAETAEAAETRAVAGHALGTILGLLHPAMPFVTETLWHQLGYGQAASLIVSAWPAAAAVAAPEEARAELDWLIRLITAVRTVRTEMNVPPAQLSPVLLLNASPTTLARAARWQPAIGRLARASEVAALSGGVPPGAAQLGLDEAHIVLPLAGLIDLAAERARLGREQASVEAEARKLADRLANADFRARAKPDVIGESEARLAAARREADRLAAAIARIA